MVLHIPEDVPNELWMNIFESMDSPADLCSVVSTCKVFYESGIRPLYRNLKWTDLVAISGSLHAWDESPQLCKDVRTLEFSVSTIPAYYPAIFVGARGTTFPSQLAGVSDARTVQPIPLSYFRAGKLSEQLFAHGPLYETILARVNTFTNLSRLVLKDILFTDRLYNTIHTLPSLRQLHIESCLSPRRQTLTGRAVRDPTTLPITELSLVNIRRALINFGDPVETRHAEDDILPILSLARAHNLRTLRVDPTADVFNRVYVLWNHVQSNFTFHHPPHLEELHVERKRSLRDRNPQMTNDGSFPDRSIYKVLSRCPTIRTFTIAQSLPQHTPYPINALPNLKHFQGLAEAVHIVTNHKKLDAISILHSDSVSNFLGVLDNIARAQPELKMLSIEVLRWNNELLHAIPQLFPELRRLHVTYLYGSPTESEASSWGPLFLSRIPNLHTFQCYAAPHRSLRYYRPEGMNILENPRPVSQQSLVGEVYDTQPSNYPDHPYLFDDTWDSIESELRDLLIPWNRFCKSLRVVQLCRSWRMRRTYDGGRWDAAKVKDGSPYDFPETFDY